MTFKRTHKAGRNFLLKGEKRAKGHSQCLTNLASSFKCHPKVKGNSKIYPRRIFKDRRDVGGGAFSATLPLCLLSASLMGCPNPICVKKQFCSQKPTFLFFFLSSHNLLYHFSVDIGEVILDNLVNCSFNFLIVFFI